MSKSNPNNDEIAYGPSCSKKLRVQLPRQMQLRDIKRNSIRNRPHTPASPLNLCDLPTEILKEIIGNINIWHHNRIRATSKRMKDISDGFVMHEFKKALAKHLRLNPCSYQSAVLRTIKQATEVYVQSGFESLFCGCILPMLRSSYKDPFCPQSHQINTFLLHFFEMVENVTGDPTSQESRLLYNLTLLRFFRAFNTSTVIASRSLPLHWRIVVELRGPWLGMLWTSKGQSQNQTCKQSHLMVILSELLIATIAGRAFKRVWECGSEIYVYGNDTSNERRVPRTLFTITVHGSKKICSLFSKCLEDDPSQFIWPPKWPKDQFTVNVDIACREATKWGCSKSQHLEFSPFAKQSFSDEDLNSSESSSKSIIFNTNC